jgi:regulation of enolase protein 1 (concanavalin A-like superfamily)
VIAATPARTTLRAQTPQNPVQIENAKPGTTDWKLTNPGWTTGVIEAYADVTSVNRGGQIKFFVNTSDPAYRIEIFRIGYYQGLGGRRITDPVTVAGTKQTIPSPDPNTGLIECNWINPYVLTIPNSADPTDWMSGYYYAKLSSSSGVQWYVTFVVRDDARRSDLIMAQAVTTAEAYNPWGGKSLYGTLADRSDTANASRKTSFHRPYDGEETWGAGQFSDQSDFKFWEWGMVQFLEQNGYDVSYATNIDVDRDSNLLLNHKAFLSVGHDEYWSWQMRDNVEHARDVGVSLGFFSADVSYWQVRFEDSPTTGDPYSVMVGYKDYCSQDPITPTYLRTCRFREAPVNRSEDQMVGIMYITQSRQPFIVEDASHWLFTGTGLKNGDSLVNPDGSYFIGYEVDALGPNSPLNLERAGHSPATPDNANFEDMTVYRASSGATVFATGSILWTYNVPQMVQLTKNALARLITNAFPDTTPVRPQLPTPFQATDIGNVGRPGFVALAGMDSFTLNGAGQDAFTGNDALFYAYQGLQGDGSITARLTGVQDYWDNRAGLMIRQSLAANAPYVSVVSRPSESKMNGTSGVNEGVEFKVKTAAGGRPTVAAQLDLPMPNWVRLTRTGNVFDAYMSADGSAWTHFGSLTLAMSGPVYIGASVASAQHAVWVTARFDHVAVLTGSGGPTDTRPPSVAMKTPAPGATVSGTVSVTASATDDVSVAGVQFKLDNANLGSEVALAPYTVAWDTTSAADGSHTLTAVARDASGKTATASSVNVTVNNRAAQSVLPAGWSHGDIGAVGPPGDAGYDQSTQTFIVTGAGADVWGTADAFQYAYTTLNGDGTIVARVATISAGASWIKAGVMLRDTLDASSAHGFMLVSSAKGAAFQRRVAAGGASTGNTVVGVVAPYWVKLERSVNTITASQSADGVSWTIVATDAIPMGSQILAGLAVSSHTNAATATATFDHVSITAKGGDLTPPSVSITAPASGATVSGAMTVSANASDNVGIAGVQFKLDGANLGTEVTHSPYAITWNTTTAANGAHSLVAIARDAAGNTATSTAVSVTVNNQAQETLPSGWSHGDVGAVGPPGNAGYDEVTQTFTVSGAGADVWGTADAFHFAYTPMSGDGTIVARVASVSAGAAWVKAGVMLRDTLDPSASQAFMLVSYTKGTAFQRRTATGGLSTSTSGAAVPAPYWVKLVRAGNQFTASESSDGVTWTVVAKDTITMGSQILAGVAVSSHTNTATATATFDHVSVTPPGPPSDTTAPTVAITAPASGSTVGGTTVVSATASDNVGVAGVQFTLDGANLGAEIPTAPYNASWNTTSVANGTHALTAVARDAAGNKSTSAPISVTVNNQSNPGQCASVTLSRTSFYSGGPASNWSITVSAPSNSCTWTASIDQPWLVLNTVTGPTTIAGTGSGVISLQTTDNATGAFRFGTFTIAGTSYKVTQETK